jgi:hypothetical protein
MVIRLKEVLTNICNEVTPDGDIKAITTLHNGAIIIKLDSEPLASWLRNPTGHALLEGLFESTVSFCSCMYAFILE